MDVPKHFQEKGARSASYDNVIRAHKPKYIMVDYEYKNYVLLQEAYNSQKVKDVICYPKWNSSL